MGKGRSILILLLAAGLALLAGAFYTGRGCYEFVRTAHAVTGQVVSQRYYDSHVGSDRGRHYPTVRFTLPSGAIVRTELTDTWSKAPYAIGRYMPLLYVQMPGQPIKVRSGDWTDVWQGPLMMGGVGLLFALPFFFSIASSLLASARISRLRRNGHKIEAKLTGVVADNSTQINGRGAYRIEATWKYPLGDTEVAFRSERLWTDPTPNLKGETITVYVNPSDPGDYSVDLSFLPK